jgi:hypothetical protein
MTTEYNEDTGLFTIREPFFFGLFHHKKNISEKDLSINKINELKEQAHKTTFTNEDLDVLYKFACLEFGFNKDRKEFREIPIKDIFKVKPDQLVLNKLVPMAYNYTDKVSQGKKPIIQKVNITTICTKECNNFYLRILIFILFIIFLILLLVLCLKNF